MLLIYKEINYLKKRNMQEEGKKRQKREEK